MILDGEKKEEYREIKRYYTSRFTKLFGSGTLSRSQFQLDKAHSGIELIENGKPVVRKICFRNGYGSDRPYFIAKCTLSVGEGREEWGAVKGEDYYILHIQEIAEKRGC
jgi:hypothetical protein